LTLDECDTDLKSIKAYRDQGLLNIERERLIEFLQHCIDYSRDWPDAITRHDPSKVVAPHRGETYVLYDETNDSLISDLRQLFSVPNELWTASHPDIGFSDCPYRIDVVSVARKGRPDSLLGYQWLAEQAADGVFDAFDTYRDYRRAIAYPEWYDSNVASGFD
jgi:hypothetical protein